MPPLAVVDLKSVAGGRSLEGGGEEAVHSLAERWQSG